MTGWGPALKGPEENSRGQRPRKQTGIEHYCRTPKGFNPSPGGFDPFRVGKLHRGARSVGFIRQLTDYYLVPLRGTAGRARIADLAFRSAPGSGGSIRSMFTAKRSGWKNSITCTIIRSCAAW